jgi:hypothetical protein
MSPQAFVAFPSAPREIGETIKRAIQRSAASGPPNAFLPWTSLDVSGKAIAKAILAQIHSANSLIADISILNSNVSYEIGYAVGTKTSTRFIINKVYLERASEELRRVGLFDTVGYQIYENSSDLADYLNSIRSSRIDPLFVPDGFDRKSPVYVIDSPHQSDLAVRIIQQAKKHFIMPRIFDPKEKARLPILEAIENVARSWLVVVSMLPPHYPEAGLHNTRSSFAAGVAHGLGRELIIFQLSADAPPLDFRDDVTLALSLEQIDSPIQALAPAVYRSLLLEETPRDSSRLTFLEGLNIGSNVAEEEEDGLSSYYYPMDPGQSEVRHE